MPAARSAAMAASMRSSAVRPAGNWPGSPTSGYVDGRRGWGPKVNLFRRTGPHRFALGNQRQAALWMWLEPGADDFRVPSGSIVELVVEARRSTPCEADFDVSDSHVVFFAP